MKKKNLLSAHPHSHSHFGAFSSIRPFTDIEPVGLPNHLEWLASHLPLYADSYIEDLDPEWAELDYSLEVGETPDRFAEFVRQYDWRVYVFEPELAENE